MSAPIEVEKATATTPPAGVSPTGGVLGEKMGPALSVRRKKKPASQSRYSCISFCANDASQAPSSASVDDIPVNQRVDEYVAKPQPQFAPLAVLSELVNPLILCLSLSALQATEDDLVEAKAIAARMSLEEVHAVSRDPLAWPSVMYLACTLWLTQSPHPAVDYEGRYEDSQ